MIEIYLYLSVLISFVLMFDGYYLKKNDGLCLGSKPLAITTSIEFIWFFVTLFAMVKLEFSVINLIVPALYVTHNVIGWVYGLSLVPSMSPSDLEEGNMRVSQWYMNFSSSFALVFFAASIYCSLKF